MANNPYGGKKRRIKAARVTHVSLVRRGKNKMPVLMKGEGDGPFELHTQLAKVDAEGVLTAIVWPANRPDRDGDFADEATVKQMAHDFLGYGGKLDMSHDLRPLTPEQVQLCESFIVQKGDARFQGWKDNDGVEVGDLSGSWAQVYRLKDPAIRQLFVDGGWNGVSLYGPCVTEPIAKSDDTTTEINDMDIKELSAAIASAVTEGVKGAMAALKPEAPKVEAKSEPTLPAFEGDINDPAAIAAHEDKLFLAGLDMSKPADIARAKARAEKLTAKKSDEGKGSELEQAKEALKLANERLKKAEGASNQPTGDETPPAEGTEVVSKEDTERLSAGKKLAMLANKSRGYVTKK